MRTPHVPLAAGLLTLALLLAGGAAATAASAPLQPSSTAPGSGRVGTTDHILTTVWTAVGQVQSGRIYVYRSLNSGKTWQSYFVTSDATHGGGVASLTLDFANRSDGWLLVMGSPGVGNAPWAIFHTVNGGATWTREPAQGSPFVRGDGQAQIHFTTDETGYIDTLIPMYSPMRVYVWVTHNAGLDWTEHYFTLPSSEPFSGQVTAPKFTTARAGTLEVVPADGGAPLTYATTDGGAVWLPIH